MYSFYRKMHFWERGVYGTRVRNFSKNYRNIVIVPAAMAKLLKWCNGWEQSSWASVRRRLSYDVTLTGTDADCPHTHNSSYPHRPLGLHQSCTHPTVRFCSPAGGRYVGPPTAMSNMLLCIQVDATFTTLPGPPMQTMLNWDEGRSILVFSPSTAMKSRPAYYIRVRIICKISWYQFYCSIALNCIWWIFFIIF